MSTPTTRTNPYLGLTREQMLITMRKLRADEERNHYLMGLLHNAVADSQLLEGTTYKTPADFFCENVQGLSRASLLRDGTVAREFSQEVVARFGVTRLEQLLAYKKAAQLTLNPDEPGATFILVPQDNGDVKPQRFAGCTLRDMRRAMEHLRSPGSYLPISPANQARYERYREAILRRFPKGVRVLMRNDEGTTMMGFEAIPLEEVHEFLAVLREVSKELGEPSEEEETPEPH